MGGSWNALTRWKQTIPISYDCFTYPPLHAIMFSGIWIIASAQPNCSSRLLRPRRRWCRRPHETFELGTFQHARLEWWRYHRFSHCRWIETIVCNTMVINVLYFLLILPIFLPNGHWRPVFILTLSSPARSQVSRLDPKNGGVGVQRVRQRGRRHHVRLHSVRGHWENLSSSFRIPAWAHFVCYEHVWPFNAETSASGRSEWGNLWSTFTAKIIFELVGKNGWIASSESITNAKAISVGYESRKKEVRII